MKKIFYTVIILFLPFIGCSQTNYNELTPEEYNNITFNGVTLLELINFNGDIHNLSDLFGFAFTDVTHPQNDEGKDYESSSISISYFENELASIEVSTSNIIVNINGTNIRIGDNISLLGYGNTGSGFNSFPDPDDNSKHITVFRPYYNDTDVYMVFNFETGIIEEIRYFSPT